MLVSMENSLPDIVNDQFIERLNSADVKLGLFNFREIWQYRHMLWHLVIRDLKSRYKQTVLGILWSMVNPFVTMVLFTFVFGELANVPTYNIPYPVFSFAALVPWTFFARCMTVIPYSLLANSSLITKIYFPRILLPLAALITSVVDFVIAFVMLLVLMVIFHVSLSVSTIIWIPFFTLLLTLTSLGLGLVLAALNVHMRDIGYLLPFLLQGFQFLSPIAYSTNLLHEPLQTLAGLNPLVAVCDGYRWALLGIDSFHPAAIVLSTISSVAILMFGYVVFRRMEPTFSDVI